MPSLAGMEMGVEDVTNALELSLQSRSQNFPSQAVKGVFFCFNSIYLFSLFLLPSWLPAGSKNWSLGWSVHHRHITSSHQSSQNQKGSGKLPERFRKALV